MIGDRFVLIIIMRARNVNDDSKKKCVQNIAIGTHSMV